LYERPGRSQTAPKSASLPESGSPGGEILRGWGPLACDPGIGLYQSVKRVGDLRPRAVVTEAFRPMRRALSRLHWDGLAVRPPTHHSRTLATFPSNQSNC